MTTPQLIQPTAVSSAPEASGSESGRRSVWLSVVGYGLSLGVLLLMLALACATIVVPRLTGSVPLTVLSNSMAPSMPVGSLVVVRPTMDLDAHSNIRTLSHDELRAANDTRALRVGDVIAYQPNASDPTLIVHRITTVTVRADGTREFVTQGDNNAAPDAPVQDYQVRAVAWYHLPYLGYVNNFLNADGARHTTAVIIIAVAGYSAAMVLLWRALATRRRERGQAQTADAEAAADSSDANEATDANEAGEAGDTSDPLHDLFR